MYIFYVQILTECDAKSKSILNIFI